MICHFFFGLAFLSLSHGSPLISNVPPLTQPDFESRTPFLAKLHYFNAESGRFSPTPHCGGGIFVQTRSKDSYSFFMLTAAHCVAPHNNSDLLVIANQVDTKWDPSDDSAKTAVFFVDHRAYPNDRYEGWPAVRGPKGGFLQLGRDVPNDIAILKLTPHPITLNNAFNLLDVLIPYKFQFDDGSAKINDRLDMVGWGVVDEIAANSRQACKYSTCRQQCL
jgi:hypothetical protein